MSSKDKVSIIVPVYNAQKSIEQCLSSIINQTYNNIEVIMVNDGSTDNSKDICESYAVKYDNIKLINQENSGPSVARNRGIEVASGRYIQFVDSDDKIDSDMVEKLVSGIDDEIDLVICGYRKIFMDLGTKKTVKRIPSISGIKSKEDFLNIFGECFRGWIINPPWNKLYVLNIIKDGGNKFDPNVSIGEDLIFNLNYVNKCKKINILNDALYNYIALEEGSLTRSYQKNHFENQKMLFVEVRKFLIENNSYHRENKDLINTMCMNSIINCFENIINTKNDLKFKCRMDEIKTIIKDETVFNTLKDINKDELSFQNKIISILLENNFPYGIYIFFIIKEIVRKNFRFAFKLAKRINN